MCTLYTVYSISSALLHLLKYIANIPVACCSLSIDAIGIVNEKHKIHSRFIQIFNNDNEIASQMQIIISIITIKAYSEPVSTLISIIVRQHCLNLGTKWSISFPWTHPTNAIHIHTYRQNEYVNMWIEHTEWRRLPIDFKRRSLWFLFQKIHFHSIYTCDSLSMKTRVACC